MRAAMAIHDELVRTAIREHRGHLVEMGREGDSVLAVFPWAADAVTAAATIQRQFRRQDWPVGAELRIRIAVHTGEAELRDGHYYGQAVYRCARLLAAGNGGQVLLSLSARQVAVDSLPDGVSLIDQGEHRLKDLVRPERIYQLADEHAPPDLRPIRSLDRRLTNLPTQLTELIGRERALADLAEARTKARLITLTGAGGSGKTRLALELAAGAEEPDGVWLIELGSLSDHASVVSAVGRVLGLVEHPGRSGTESAVDQLSGRELLLVLDNCEHLVTAVAELVEKLLEGCPALRVLATSREPLGLPGEVTWPVPALREEDAAALFLRRAREHRPDLPDDEGARRLAAQVCARLDCLPLALELAAAQADALSLPAIVARLEDRFVLLSRGSRTAPARQQTLRSTVEWSHNLLASDERLLLRRLSVFTGTFDLAAAEAVGAGGELALAAVVPFLALLVRKSLLVPTESRYQMHETIREFAREKLEESGEAPDVQGRLALYLLDRIERRIPGRSAEWLDEVEVEHGNLQSALAWATETNPPLALRLAHRAFDFWNVRGHVAEGRAAVEAALAAAPDSGADSAQCRIDSAAFAYLQGEAPEALLRLGRALAAGQSAGDDRVTGRALFMTGLVEAATGAPVRAEAHLEEALSLWQTMGDGRMEAEVLHQMGLLAGSRGDLAAAEQLFARSLELRHRAGHDDEAHITLTFLAAVRVAGGGIEGARSAIRQSLESGLRLGDRRAAWTLDVCSWIAAADSNPARALTLAGAAARMHEVAGSKPTPAWLALTDSFLRAGRAGLPPTESALAWESGAVLSYLEAIAYGLEAPGGAGGAED